MLSKAKCPHCDLQLRNEVPGSVITCPGCRKQFQMPSPAESIVDGWDETETEPQSEGDLLLHHIVECKESLHQIDSVVSRAASTLTDAEATVRHLSQQVKTLNTLVFVIAIPFILSLGLWLLLLLLFFTGVIGSRF